MIIWLQESCNGRSGGIVAEWLEGVKEREEGGSMEEGKGLDTV